MSNYPDDFPDHLLDEDMDGVEKLSCGCYEECCECPKCNCGEIIDDDNHICNQCVENCEHEEFELTSEEAGVDGVMILKYICNDCGAIGEVIYRIGEILWGEKA
jgi:hypothetical protein